MRGSAKRLVACVLMGIIAVGVHSKKVHAANALSSWCTITQINTYYTGVGIYFACPGISANISGCSSQSFEIQPAIITDDELLRFTRSLALAAFAAGKTVAVSYDTTDPCPNASHIRATAIYVK